MSKSDVLELRSFLCEVDCRKPVNLDFVALKNYGEYLVSIGKLDRKVWEDFLNGLGS